MAKKSEAGGVGTMDPLKTPGSGEEMGGAEDPHGIVAEHGPATHTMTEHPSEEGGSHMAHSMHPDGHEHHSEHKDGKSAHEHAMCLSGHCDHGGEAEPDGDEPSFE